MSDSAEHNGEGPEKRDDAKDPPENMFKMIDDLLSHTNSSRRIFLIFIASALIFAPVALVMGGILIGHPRYSVFHLESNHEEISRNMDMANYTSVNGSQFFIVEKSGGAIVHQFPIHPPPRFMHQDRAIFIGIQIFIVTCLVFAAVLLFVALKEYRFFAKWNVRYKKYRETQDKIDDELSKE